MKMVGVSRVVLWPQRVTEVMATAAQQRRQPGARSLAPPALQDANASTVRQTETADVQRVRRGVFTAPRLLTMVNIAAGKAAEMIDLTQIARHQLPGQRLRLLLDVQRTAQRQRQLARKLLLSCTEPKFATRTTLRRGQLPSLSATGRLAISRRRLASASKEAHWSAVSLRSLNDVSQPGGIVQRQRRQRIQVRRQIAVSQQARAEPGQHQQRLSSHAHSRQLIR